MANFNSRGCGRWLSRLAPLLCVAACNKSGQTGSPQNDAEEPPIYTSPPTFEPGSPTGEGTDGGLGEGYHFNLDNPEARRLSATSGDTLYVFASPEEYRGPFSTERQRGLLVYDISDAAEPKLRGELEIPGHPAKMYTEDGLLTLIVVQPNDEEYTEVPSEPAPAQITRVLQVDVSKPSAPKLTGQIDIPGYTRSYKLPEGLVVVTDVPQPGECRIEPEGGHGTGLGEPFGLVPESDARVTLVDVSGAKPMRLDDLKLEGFHVGLGTAGSEVLLGHFVRQESGLLSAELLLLEAADGKLRTGETASIEGRVTAAYLGGGRAVVATEQDGAGRAVAFTLDDDLSLSPLGEVALPGNTGAEGASIVAAGPNAVLVSPESFGADDSSTWVAFGEELSATQVPATNLWLMAPDPETDAERFLVVTRSETGHATLEVWGADESSKLTTLVEEETDWPHVRLKQAASIFDADTGTLLYPSVVYDQDRGVSLGRLGTASVTAGEITASPSRETVAAATGPVSGGAAAYVSGADGISVVPLDGEAASTLPVYPELDGRVVDELRVGETGVTLRHVGKKMLMEFAQGDAEPKRFTLDHTAQELLQFDDSVLALGLRGLDYCQGDPAELPDFAAGEAFECPEPGVVGLTLFDVKGSPKEVWSKPLPDSFDAPELPKDASFRSSWSGYMMLGDGRLALPMSAHISCESRAACKALDIVGEEGQQSSPGCASDEQNCDEQPPVVNFFSGGRSEARIYTLDLSEEDGPELTEELALSKRYRLHGEGPLALDDQVLRAGDVLGFAGEEPIRGTAPDGEEQRRLAFYLTRADLSGPEATSERINTPGFPFALLAKGTQLLSLEPDGEDAEGPRDALLHLSELRGSGAFIEDTVNLGAGYRDHTRVSDRLFLLFGPETQCADDPESRVFSVDVKNDKIRVLPELRLPRDDYSFVWYERPWPEDSLLLGSGRSGRLLLDVSDKKTAPEFQRFFVKAR